MGRALAQIDVIPGSAEPFTFDAQALTALARSLNSRYASADPFPHVVIDDFLPAHVAEGMLEDFPGPSAPCWQADEKGPQAGKLGTRHASRMVGVPGRLYLNLLAFNSSSFVEFLEDLTGITGLIPDPHFIGGGLHQNPRGAKLEIHADFNRYKRLALDRRINALFFLNPNWDPKWGGQLELWDRDMKECRQRLDPIFNRLVVFNTTSDSYHGHPDPLVCPNEVTRKSLAFYYYSNGRPASERRRAHSTLWQRRPGDEKRAVGAGDLLPAARKALRRWMPQAVKDLFGRRST